MATTYLSPGVYIEEVDRGTKPIQGVPTAIAAFVGFTEKAQEPTDDGFTTRSILSKPKLITNWGQYVQHFGDLIEDAYLPYAVRGFFDNGGSICYVISVRTMGPRHPAQALIATGADKPGRPQRPSLVVHARSIARDGKVLDGEKVTVEVSLVSKTAASAGEGPAAPAAAQQPAGEEATVGGAGDEPKPGDGKSKEGDTASRKAPKPDIGHGKPPAAASGAASDDKLQLKFDIYLGDGEKVLPAQTVYCDYEQLPSWAGRQREDPTDHDRFSHIKVWAAAEPGPLKERLPAEGRVPLANFAWQIDTELLENRGAADQQLRQAGNGTVDKLFEANSIRLFEGNTPNRKGIAALEAIDNVNLVCAPDLMLAHERNWIKTEQLVGIQKTILKHCELTHYRFAILDAPHDCRSAESVLAWRRQANHDSMHGALYFPWIKIADPVTNRSRFLPPSGYIAGIYARSDDQRGVHKAPANEVVAGAIDVATNVTKIEQSLLNPEGINCIRSFPGRGIRVWGARTLASDPAWRYINVRRLFNYVEESIERNTQWIVFEPNDHILWAKVRRDITAFLRTVWLSGALFGKTPEEAFYVKCDESTNLPELRDLGQMVCEIGMAPVKPAEFVIFRFSQWTSEADAAS
jgi:phage tail sheath protein FI